MGKRTLFDEHIATASPDYEVLSNSIRHIEWFHLGRTSDGKRKGTWCSHMVRAG